MTFEKALEAMRQGKRVHRKAWRDTEIYLSSTTLFTMICDDVFADDWEIYEEPKQRKPEMTAEKAKKILRAVRTESILCNKYFEDCTLDELVAAIDFALEILKKQAEKEKKVSQLAETSQKILKKRHISHENGKESNTTEYNCNNDSILDTIAMTKYHLGFTLAADELARVSRIEKGSKDNA